LQVTIYNDLQPFEASGLLLDVSRTHFTEELSPFFTKLNCDHMNEVISENGAFNGAFALRFRNIQDLERAITECPKALLVPMLSPNRHRYDPSGIVPLGVSPLDSLYDFQLIWHGKSYGIIKSIARGLSQTISRSTSASLVVPNLIGPFEMIVDFLRLEQIVITPETELFLERMAHFLEIEMISKPLCNRPSTSLNVSNLPVFFEVVPPGSSYFDEVCQFVARNLKEIKEGGTLMDIPFDVAQRVLEHFAPDLLSHNELLPLILALNLDPERLGEMLVFVDTAKVSHDVLATFVSNPVVDLGGEGVRDFLSRILKGKGIRPFSHVFVWHCTEKGQPARAVPT
jgi:hypothetical protein